MNHRMAFVIRSNDMTNRLFGVCVQNGRRRKSDKNAHCKRNPNNHNNNNYKKIRERKKTTTTSAAYISRMVTAPKKSSTCTPLSMQVLSHLLTNLAKAIFITFRFEVALGDLC